MFSKLLRVAVIGVTALAMTPILSLAATVTCSYYSNKYNARRIASGQHFSNSAMTAAHQTLPFGTKVKLTNPKNHHSVTVTVNDRGPYLKGREISVTRAAAKQLGFIRAGVAQLDPETVK
jgi:rare lipoprotein A